MKRNIIFLWVGPRTAKERAARLSLENRVQEVDANIHKLRQELRLSGALQRSFKYA